MSPREEVLDLLARGKPGKDRPARGEIWVAPPVLRDSGFPNSAAGVAGLAARLGADLCFFSCGGPQPVAPEAGALCEAVSLAKSFGLACGAVINGPWQRLTGDNDIITLLQNIKREPQNLREALDKQAARMGEEAESWAQVGADLILIADDVAHAGGPYFSPAHFNELLVPCYRRHLFRAGKRTASPLGFHSDGEMSLLLPVLVETGFTFFSLEPETTDIPALWQRHGSRTTVLSAIKAAWLSQPPATETRSEATAYFSLLLGRGSLVLSSACGLFHQNSVDALKEIYACADSLAGGEQR